MLRSPTGAGEYSGRSCACEPRAQRLVTLSQLGKADESGLGAPYRRVCPRGVQQVRTIANVFLTILEPASGPSGGNHSFLCSEPWRTVWARSAASAMMHNLVVFTSMSCLNSRPMYPPARSHVHVQLAGVGIFNHVLKIAHWTEVRGKAWGGGGGRELEGGKCNPSEECRG